MVVQTTENGELTRSQLSTVPFTSDLPTPSGIKSWDTYRTTRKNPTVWLTRQLLLAAVLSAEWSIVEKEDAPEGAADDIRNELFPHKGRVLRPAVLGGVDFGWQPYEKVYIVRADNKLGIDKLKPLLQDITEIKIVPGTGSFDGFYQDQDHTRLPVELSLLISFEVEGTQWYGYPLMENVRPLVDSWNNTEKYSKRYDEKMAGATWVIKHPNGTSTLNGVDKEDHDVATDLLKQIRSGAGLAIPSTAKHSDELGDEAPAWEVEIMEASGSSRASFGERQQYLDKQIVRAMGFPERSILEGEFGTKAEATAHAEFTILMMDQRHGHILDHVNPFVVNKLLTFNYGPEAKDTIQVRNEPLVDSKKAIIVELYSQLMSGNAELLLDRLDLDQIEEVLGVPMRPDAPDVDGPIDDIDKEFHVPADARAIAEVVQKVYLGVGQVLTQEEAREIVRKAGADIVPGAAVPSAV